MPSTVEKSVEVNAPISTVYNQWTQFEQFPKFMEGVEEVKQLNDKRLHWKVKVDGNYRYFRCHLPAAHHQQVNYSNNFSHLATRAHTLTWKISSRPPSPRGFRPIP